jgi:hypothetical protein
MMVNAHIVLMAIFQSKVNAKHVLRSIARNAQLMIALLVKTLIL